ncbi:phytanoyl-CoA dioxygenase family protein [uncultured Paludibaculum sp.]|uniref:phytanoyl-CoA dioxygenase family protein n=1 Tax=uncultured Paludibaculum sp. TaxID=1765020 RepID=UPI002AAC36D2|nr:phytanoyl-CoA dioxygenase family protein [uncultured Paludibaculum sp.]
MQNVVRQLESKGFAVLPDVFDQLAIEHLIDGVSQIEPQSGVRTRTGVYAVRNLLELSPAAATLAASGTLRSIVEEYLAPAAFPVRGTLFDKTEGANWLVPWHQDLTICVEGRIDVPGYGPWSTKAGVWHVQPPASVLEQMLSVRIHLDDCREDNGALRVLPGTHRLGRLDAEEIARLQGSRPSTLCAVGAGGVLLMRPLLLHASSAATKAAHRRVIHIDYARSPLDGGLVWRAAALSRQP